MSGLKFRRGVVLPISLCAAVALVTALTWVFLDYSMEVGWLTEEFERKGAAGFEGLVGQETQRLLMMQTVVFGDVALNGAMATGDRNAVLAAGRPLFEKLRLEQRLTYFDCIDTERAVIANFSDPSAAGDIRANHILQMAQSLDEPVFGLELSKQMTLVLRTCAPWVVDGRTVGYLQLGFDIDGIIDDLSRVDNLDHVIAIDKAYVSREKWQAGMRRLGRNADWSRHEDFVTVGETTVFPDDALNAMLSAAAREEADPVTFSDRGRFFASTAAPLVDSSFRPIGRLIMIGDATPTRRALIYDFWITVAISLAASFLGLILFTRVVTRLEHKLELELSEKREAELGMIRFRQFADAVGQGLGMTDLRGKILYVNPGMCRMLGIDDPSDLVGSDMAPFYSLKVQAMMESMLLRLLETGHMSGEVDMRTVDGRLVPTLQNATVIRDDNGEPLCLANVITDISEQKRMEQALRATRDELEARVRERTEELARSNAELEIEVRERKLTEEVLRESEHDYRILIDTSPYGIIITDMTLKPTIVNRAMLRMFGYTEEEFCGSGLDGSNFIENQGDMFNAAMLDILGYTEEEFCRSDLVEPFVSGREDGADRVERGMIAFERELERKDGSSFPVALTAWLTRDIHGHGRSIGVFIEDITERKRGEQTIKNHAEILEQTVRERTRELEEARREAEVANEAKSAFLANMSHEIRTPMAAIMGFTEMLLTPRQDEDRRLRAIHSIRKSGEHLLSLINNILDLSKIEAGRTELVLGDHAPLQILEEVSTLLQPRAEAKGIELAFEVTGEYPSGIRTDPIRLRQVLINLVGNAIKFTETGRVEVRTRRLEGPDDDPRLEFEIEDTGIGIRESDMGKLFRPFSQADASTSRAFGGTGLGLAISKQLVEILGGEMSVRSTPGAGSVFRFTIGARPAAGAHLVEDAVIRPKREADVRRVDVKDIVALRNCRILLVEDVPENQEIISFILREAGCRVDFADNGRVGVERALAALERGTPYDVILMDMQMPVMDGYRATERLRGLDYTGAIIALTAHAMSDDGDKCRAAGCDEYATKPVDPDRLLGLVESFFGGRRDDGPPEPPAPRSEPPESGAADDDPPVFDYESLLKRCAGKTEFAASMVAKFDAHLDGMVEEIEAAMAGHSPEEVARLAHKLKGSAGNLGFSALQETCRQIESAASGRDCEGDGCDEAKLLIRHLKEETVKLRQAIGDQLDMNSELRQT